MVEHTQTIRQLLPTNFLSLSDHFVGLVSKGLILISDRTVLYGNVAFLILALSTKKSYSSFLEKVFILQNICFKVKILKMFQISSDSYIKTSISQAEGPFENP